MIGLRLRIHGRVQGVGFRPFIYRLAHDLNLTGWVQNLSGEVEVLIQGDSDPLAIFRQRVIDDAPPLAQPVLGSVESVAVKPLNDFTIHPSAAGETPDIHVPPDYFTCDDCLAELTNPTARRYRYPFINCTQCGPRYTLIRALPYDRPNTTLADFPLCEDCRAEYENPLDRRFHAQPLACPICGPRLEFQSGSPLSQRGAGGDLRGEAALKACLEALQTGQIVAVKGIGGYHMMCDATNDNTVQRLRKRKRRPHKPLAVMFPQRGEDGLKIVREFVKLDDMTARALRNPMRPIVLAAKLPDTDLAPGVAPDLEELGVFLPYSPLHHLLLNDFDGPLVATSGNLSDEPVLTDNHEANARLGAVAEAFLHHDRPIERPADDPVYRVIAGRPRPMRLGRGNAPLELTLPRSLAKPVLALGGHMKVTVALGWENRVVISPHMGDLDSPRGLQVFEQVCRDLPKLYGISPQGLISDAHPGYAGTRWAKRQPLPVLEIFHHHAHACALAGEHPEVGRWLTFTWDGVGYGPDGTLWGGEALWGRPGDWLHVAGLRRFRLTGGDRAGREPWRSAAALCWEAGLPWQAIDDVFIARQAWEKNINSPISSAAGRVFDAAATLVLGIHCTSFEGQGPMLLEALAGKDDDSVTLPLVKDEAGIFRADWAPLLPILRDGKLPPGQRSAIFHNSMADTILHQALTLKEHYPYEGVGLTGGVFQNRLISERAINRLTSMGIPVYLHQTVPCNDGGLSYGQIIAACHP